MNFILRINVPSTLNVVAQHTKVLIVSYSFDSHLENNKSHSDLVQYILTLKTYQHIN